MIYLKALGAALLIAVLATLAVFLGALMAALAVHIVEGLA